MRSLPDSSDQGGEREALIRAGLVRTSTGV